MEFSCPLLMQPIYFSSFTGKEIENMNSRAISHTQKGQRHRAYFFLRISQERLKERS